jgi:hypothetical protein
LASPIKLNHKGYTGKHHTKNTKRKISKVNKGKILSEETRKRIGLKLSEVHKGRHWFNNGNIEKLFFNFPVGWNIGRL